MVDFIKIWLLFMGIAGVVMAVGWGLAELILFLPFWTFPITFVFLVATLFAFLIVKNN